MKRLKSNLLNMTLSLTLIALVAAGLLGVVNMFTKEPIEQSKQQKQEQAIIAVLPQIDSLKIQAPDTVSGLVLHRAMVGDEQVGVAVEATTDPGFSGEFRLMVGFDAEGNIVNYVVLEHQETPGLGAKMDKWFKDSAHTIIGLNPSTTPFVPRKKGEKIDGVDAITAATITSRAFLGAIDKAYKAAFAEISENSEPSENSEESLTPEKY